MTALKPLKGRSATTTLANADADLELQAVTVSVAQPDSGTTPLPVASLVTVIPNFQLALVATR